MIKMCLNEQFIVRSTTRAYKVVLSDWSHKAFPHYFIIPLFYTHLNIQIYNL